MIPGSRSRPTAHSTLCGRHEAAELLGVDVETVDKWRQRDVGFPDPDYPLKGGPVWWSSSIVEWARRTGRI